MLRSVVVGLAVLAAAGVLLLALLWVVQRQLIYLPDRGPVPPAAEVLPGARDVVLRTDDGVDLAAWYLPAGGDAPAVLVLNGNAGHRGSRAPLAQALSERGLSVLLFDYRGYGGNPGSPSEAGLALDAQAARRFLVQDAGVPPDRIVYLGESLGAAVAAGLAVEHPPAGLVLRSPFTDLASVAGVHYPLVPARLLLRDRFPVAEQVARVQAPTVVVYGTVDAVVPPQQSRAVAAAAADLRALVEVPGAGHNDGELGHGDALVDAVVDVAQPRR